jgi:hypothetical protein
LDPAQKARDLVLEPLERATVSVVRITGADDQGWADHFYLFQHPRERLGVRDVPARRPVIADNGKGKFVLRGLDEGSLAQVRERPVRNGI